MSQWIDLAKSIRHQLAHIEEAVEERSLPQDVLDEVKSAVDHCRTSLWAAAIFGDDQGDQGATAMLVEARLQRTAEMCVHLQADVAAGRIVDATGRVRLCRRVLQDTVDALGNVKQLTVPESSGELQVRPN